MEPCGGKYCRLVSGMKTAYTENMKVEGPSKPSGIKGASKTGAKKGAGGASFGSLIDETPGAGGTSSAGGVMGVSSIEALLSLQEAGDGTHGGNKRAKERASALLDELDKLRIGLLTGEIPESALNRLSHTLKIQRDNVMDPLMNEILDEIDLRVQVELAKHRPD
jgi:hypothetical protein